MKKIRVDFEHIDSNFLEFLAANYPDGFSECEVLKFTLNGKEDESRVKIFMGDTVYLVQKSVFTPASIKNEAQDKYTSPYMEEAPDACL